jgi:hypothetical protein
MLMADKQLPALQSMSVHAPTESCLSAKSANDSFKATQEERPMKQQIEINARDGTFRAYISRPAKQPAPVVVVLQELFGVRRRGTNS